MLFLRGDEPGKGFGAARAGAAIQKKKVFKFNLKWRKY
jgi:hypothetical protein